MIWRVDFSTDSLKFLKKNNLEESFVVDKIKLAVRKFRGEDINVNISRLSGKWESFYRIRFNGILFMIGFKIPFDTIG